MIQPEILIIGLAPFVLVGLTLLILLCFSDKEDK